MRVVPDNLRIWYVVDCSVFPMPVQCHVILCPHSFRMSKNKTKRKQRSSIFAQVTRDSFTLTHAHARSSYKAQAQVTVTLRQLSNLNKSDVKGQHKWQKQSNCFSSTLNPKSSSRFIWLDWGRGYQKQSLKLKSNLA